MRKTYRRKKFIPIMPRHKVNESIRVPQVRLIDDQDNNIGVIDTREALKMAREKELDLVEVSPKANPPVARILNYGSFKYKQEKQAKKQRSQVKKVETKGIRLSLGISNHDKELKLKKTQEFLSEGNRIKLEMVLRGRERQHVGLAKEIINKFTGSLDEMAKVEQPMTRQGGRLTVILAPKK